MRYTRFMGTNATSETTMGLCDHCSLPLKSGAMSASVAGKIQRFCCYGCYLCQRMIGGEGEEGAANLSMARMGLGWLLGMPVMALSIIEYVDGFGTDTPIPTQWFVHYLTFGLATAIVVLLGLPYLYTGLRSLLSGRIGADALIALGAMSAWGYSSYNLFSAETIEQAQAHLYFDSGSMILVLVSLGKYVEATARRRSTSSLRELSTLQVTGAKRFAADGSLEEVKAADLKIGDRIRVLPGDVLPCDGEVLEGESEIAEAMLTGENRPLKKTPGSLVYGATVNGSGPLTVLVRATGEDCVSARIVALAREAMQRRTRVEILVDRVARVFVPGIVFVALLAIVYQVWIVGVGEGDESALVVGIRNALSILVVSCPCALGLATPLAVAIAIARGTELGMLFRSGEDIEALAATKRMILDKTGTLTTGSFEVGDHAFPDQAQRPHILNVIRTLEEGSEHWLAKALVRWASAEGAKALAARDVHALPGRGIEGVIEGKRWWIGEAGMALSALPNELSALVKKAQERGATLVLVGCEEQALGALLLEDGPKPNAQRAIGRLHELSITTAMVTGDQEGPALRIAKELGINRVHYGIKPEGKLGILEAEGESAFTAMTGDGINDGPALMRAGVGISFKDASGLARLASGLTLMGSDLMKLPNAVLLARRTRSVIRANLVWAFLYNIVAIGFAFFGKLSPIMAAFAMLLSSLFVVRSSWKLHRFGETALRSLPTTRNT